jgi:hypothetical protein
MSDAVETSRNDEECHNLYDVYTAKAMAKSIAMISGILIATVPLVFARFSWASLLFVFPYWAIIFLFIGLGSVCAIGLYFLLKFLLTSEIHRNEHIDSHESPLSPPTTDVENEDDIEPPVEFIIGQSTRIAAATSTFLQAYTSATSRLIYMGCKTLHVSTSAGAPLIINEEFMKHLRTCDGQFYKGKFCASHIIVELFPHMLNDKLYGNENVDSVCIEYRHCNFRGIEIQENPIRVGHRTGYVFRECTITPSVFKFLKERNISDVCFDNCEFAEITNETDLQLDKVRFVGRGEELNASILNILKKTRNRADFKHYYVMQHLLDLDFCKPTVMFYFVNCTFEEGFTQKVASQKHFPIYEFTGPLAGDEEFQYLERPIKKVQFIVHYKDMEIDDDTFAEFKGLCVIVTMKRCTFRLTQKAKINFHEINFSFVTFEEDEICGAMLEVFSGENTQITFRNCIFSSLTTSKLSIRYERIDIMFCNGMEYLANSLKNSPDSKIYIEMIRIDCCSMNTDRLDGDIFSGCQFVKIADVKFQGNFPFPMLNRSDGAMELGAMRTMYDLPNRYGSINCKSVHFMFAKMQDSSAESLCGKVENILFECCSFGVLLTLNKELHISNMLHIKNNRDCESICIHNTTEIRKIQIADCECLRKISTPSGACRIVES